ncbi:hypothetical protein F5887DRAFT_941205 [Amanita rubescens]|nr:hypothetical protein F5887DRAFT_941205 [Amanita rubescens]
MFLFIPIIVGCPTKFKPTSDQQLPRVCPHCHNGSLISAKKTTWFEFFFIPLVPISKQRVWICHICRWTAPFVAGEEHPLAAYTGHHGYAVHGQEPAAPSYEPSPSYTHNAKRN